MKHKAPPGYSFPIGRDAVERALLDAGVTVSMLSFSVPVLNPPLDPPIVVDALWSGEARSGAFDRRGDSSPAWLHLSVNVVPVDVVADVRAALGEGLAGFGPWASRLRSASGRCEVAAIAEQRYVLSWLGDRFVESSD